MQNLLVIAGSSSLSSINLAFAKYAASHIDADSTRVLDLNDFEMPIYSEDREKDSGIPQPAQDFVAAIEASDGIVISLAEHNGTYTAAFKNVLDWASRHQQKLWSDKPMLLMATSPGGRGGTGVLAAAESYFPRAGADLRATFSLPSYYDTFDEENGIIDATHSETLDTAIATFTR